MDDRAMGGLEAAVSRVGDRWTLLVVDALLGGPRRFNQLLEALPGLAPNILSGRLKTLEGEALVVAVPYSRRPPRTEYRLTAAGRELGGALRLLAQWGSDHSTSPGHAAPLAHGTCGTPVEARWYCPTCARPVSDDEADDLRWV